jgi:hypothetical protein
MSAQAEFFTVFGLSVKVEWPEDCMQSPIFNRPTSNPSEVDVTVHLLGSTRMGREKVALTKRVSAPKTLRFRRKATPVGELRCLTCENASGRAEFVISDDTSQMWVSWSDNTSIEGVLTLLFNSMLAWILRLSGRICLHASVVARDGRAMAFVAPTGYGKSTLAATMIEQGYAGMTDDAAALSHHGDGYIVHPGFPQIGLRTPSLDALPRFRAETSFFTDEKRRFTLTASGADQPLRFTDRATPLAAIYFLRRSDAASEPQIVAASAAESLAMLMNRQYPTSRLPRTREIAAQHFTDLSDVVATVPCRHLIVPDALAKLPLVRERLCADLASPATVRFAI